MIVGCYSMDLYCRFHPASYGHEAGARHTAGESGGVATFTGETFTECKKTAQRHSWKFERGDVTCPACLKEKQ